MNHTHSDCQIKRQFFRSIKLLFVIKMLKYDISFVLNCSVNYVFITTKQHGRRVAREGGNHNKSGHINSCSYDLSLSTHYHKVPRTSTWRVGTSELYSPGQSGCKSPPYCSPRLEICIFSVWEVVFSPSLVSSCVHWESHRGWCAVRLTLAKRAT